MKKTNFILGITALSAMPALGQTASSRPNIVYILMDDLGFGDIGCYGQEKIETPHIDQLRQEGMRFTQHYTGSPVSAPARCVLMTGMHSGHAQIRPIAAPSMTMIPCLSTKNWKDNIRSRQTP